MATPRTIGPATQRALTALHPDPFVQVAILRVHHEAPHLLDAGVAVRLASAIRLDRLPDLKGDES